MRIATIKETAEYLRMGLSSLYKKMSADKTMPRSFRMGGRPVFNLDSIDEWVLMQENNVNAKRNDHGKK